MWEPQWQRNHGGSWWWQRQGPGGGDSSEHEVAGIGDRWNGRWTGHDWNNDSWRREDLRKRHWYEASWQAGEDQGTARYARTARVSIGQRTPIAPREPSLQEGGGDGEWQMVETAQGAEPPQQRPPPPPPQQRGPPSSTRRDVLASEASQQRWSNTNTLAGVGARASLKRDGGAWNWIEADPQDELMGEFLHGALEYTVVRHRPTASDRDSGGLDAVFQVGWTARVEVDYEEFSRYSREGLFPRVTLLVPGGNDQPRERVFQVINARETTSHEPGTLILICLQTGPYVVDGAEEPVVVFPASAFLPSAQIHQGACAQLDDLARNLTITLDCLLKDLSEYVESVPAEERTAEEGSRTGAMRYIMGRGRAGHLENFTISRFLAAIVAVANTYQDWVPMGRQDLRGEVDPAMRDVADLWVSSDERGVLTRGWAEVLVGCPRPRIYRLDPKYAFCQVCDSPHHVGPNLHLPAHLFKQTTDRSRAKYCCYQCFGLEHGEASGLSMERVRNLTCSQWLKIASVSRQLCSQEGLPPILTAQGAQALSRHSWRNLCEAQRRGLQGTRPTTYEEAFAQGVSPEVQSILEDRTGLRPYEDLLAAGPRTRSQEDRLMLNFLFYKLGQAMTAAGAERWEQLERCIKAAIPASHPELQASAFMIVLAMADWRRRLGLGRAAAIRVSADFLVTIVGVPGRKGWVGLKYCCTACGFAPRMEMGWIRLKNTGQRQLIPFKDLPEELQRVWRDNEDVAVHNIDTNPFFSRERKTNWYCAACGEEFRRSRVAEGDNPSMLLMVQTTDDAATGMRFYAADMPSGAAGNCIQLLKLGAALANAANRNTLAAMGPPDEQSAEDFVRRLAELLERENVRSLEGVEPSLAAQSRNVRVMRPRKLCPFLRSILPSRSWVQAEGLVVRETEEGDQHQFFDTFAIEGERHEGYLTQSGWDLLTELVLTSLQERDAAALMTLTREDIARGGAGMEDVEEVTAAVSALQPYVDDSHLGVSRLGTTMQWLVRAVRDHAQRVVARAETVGESSGEVIEERHERPGDEDAAREVDWLPTFRQGLRRQQEQAMDRGEVWDGGVGELPEGTTESLRLWHSGLREAVADPERRAEMAGSIVDQGVWRHPEHARNMRLAGAAAEVEMRTGHTVQPWILAATDAGRRAMDRTSPMPILRQTLRAD